MTPILNNNYSKSILFLSFLILITIGCKKENPTIKALKGTWELSSTNSGLFNILTSYPKGNGAIIKFSSNTYEKLDKGKIVERGSYSVKKDSITITRSIGDKIIFNNKEEIFFSVDESHLSFFMDVVDGGGSTYRKIDD